MQRRSLFSRWLTIWLMFSMLVVGVLNGAGLSARAAPLPRPQSAVKGDVIISEVAWGGTIGSEKDEWIELHIFNGPVSLNNWRITSKPLPFVDALPKIDITISDTRDIPAGDNYLLEREIDTVIDNIPADQIYSGPGNLLDDSGATLYLYAPKSSDPASYDLIDTVNSNGGAWPAGLPSGYGSMERYDDKYYDDSDAIWVTNINQDINGSVDFRGNLIRGTPKNINWASTITPISTTVITSSVPDPSVPNLTVKVNVSVTGGPTVPTGTVLISGADNPCTITLDNQGNGVCDVSFSSVGTKTLTANFTPTSNHTPSIGTNTHEVVTAISTTTTITNISPIPAYVGEDVTVYVKVDAESGGVKPTGTVEITGLANVANNCKVTLTDGMGNCKVRFSTVGVKTLTATYLGFGAFTTSKDTETLDAYFSSTTTITSDKPDPSNINQKVTVEVSVTGKSSVPTGIVYITGANNNCAINLTNGIGSCDVIFSSSGTKNLKATYDGDDLYYGSSDTEFHVVSFSSSGGSSGSGSSGVIQKPPVLAISEFLPRPGHDWNNDGYVNVFDEFIEIINAGLGDVNLGGYSLDDEANSGSRIYTLPAIVLKPGEHAVFYASETGVLLSDAGDTVRLLRGGSIVVDAYTYGVARYPDQSWCRIPDKLGYWSFPCFPTPGNPNALTGKFPLPSGPESGYYAPVCLLSDTTPDVFVYAECESSGDEIWNRQYWDSLDGTERIEIDIPQKWGTLFE